MPRALFQKKGNAIYISHLDLMRLFQRAFKRAGLPLTHTQGFNPRPSVSIALPLSLGTESCCELLDFDLEGENTSCDEIARRLNEELVEGIQVLSVYEDGQKLKHLAYLDCILTMEYDTGIPENAEAQILQLFRQDALCVEKKSKNGTVEQNILPMILSLSAIRDNPQELSLSARICCQNPSLNPMQLSAAIGKYLPHLKPDYVRCCRLEIYDHNQEVFR